MFNTNNTADMVVSEDGKRFFEAVKKHLTLMIIFTALGICIGLYISEKIYESKMTDAVKLQGLIHKNVVYEIKLKP